VIFQEHRGWRNGIEIGGSRKAKLVGLQKNKKWKVFEVLNEGDFVEPSNSKTEKKKTLTARNGESDRRGERSSSFILKKSRILVDLQLQLTPLRKRVVSLETWILQIKVWVIIS